MGRIVRVTCEDKNDEIDDVFSIHSRNSITPMGHQAIIYGRIQEAWEGTRTRWPVVPEYNDSILASLPDEDEHWPFLTRHMFSVFSRSFHGNAQRGEYRGRVIHFAASVNESTDGIAWQRDFLEKLEQRVLLRLLWRSAKVHFESQLYPERCVTYRANDDSIASLEAELSERRFGERIDSQVTWECSEMASPPCDFRWLY